MLSSLLSHTNISINVIIASIFIVLSLLKPRLGCAIAGTLYYHLTHDILFLIFLVLFFILSNTSEGIHINVKYVLFILLILSPFIFINHTPIALKPKPSDYISFVEAILILSSSFILTYYKEHKC